MQVALAKASGKPGAAIDLLRRHVDVYMTDREAWEELAELYVQVGGGDTRRRCAGSILGSQVTALGGLLGCIAVGKLLAASGWQL